MRELVSPLSCRWTAWWTPRAVDRVRSTAAVVGCSRTSSSCRRRTRSRARSSTRHDGADVRPAQLRGLRADVARLARTMRRTRICRSTSSPPRSAKPTSSTTGARPRSCAPTRRGRETSKRPTDGPIIIHGSATLSRNLSDAGLIDRYHLLVFPSLLGAGKRMLSDTDRDKQHAAAARVRRATRTAS